MNFESFSQGSSFLHRLDTRAKLLAALVLSLVTALCHSYATAGASILAAFTLVIVARLTPRQVLMRLLVVNGFVAFLWLTLPLTYPGTVLMELGPLSLTSQGVAVAVLITLKANAIFLLLMALLATSPVADIGHGLNRLGIPTKLCLLLLFSYRYIFVISQEYQRLLKAARLRSFTPGMNLHTYRTYGYLFGMTLVKSCHRADRVKKAMLLRGFQGRFYPLNSRSFNSADWLFSLFLFAFAAILATFELSQAITL